MAFFYSFIISLINQSSFSTDHSELTSNQLVEEVSQLRLENEKLSTRNRNLQSEVEELRRVKENIVEEDLTLKPKISEMTVELTHAKEALSGKFLLRNPKSSCSLFSSSSSSFSPSFIPHPHFLPPDFFLLRFFPALYSSSSFLSLPSSSSHPFPLPLLPRSRLFLPHPHHH